MMRRLLSLFLILTLTGCVAPHVPVTPPGPSPTPAPVPVFPDVPTTNALSDLSKASSALKNPQRKRLGEFYRTLANTLERSPIVATSRIRAAHREALTLMVSADDTFTNAPKVGTQVDAAIAEAVTLEDRDLSTTDKQKLIRRLHDIASVVGGK